MMEDTAGGLTKEQIVQRDKLSDKGRVRRLIEKVKKVLIEPKEERYRLVSEKWIDRFEAINPENMTN